MMTKKEAIASLAEMKLIPAFGESSHWQSEEQLTIFHRRQYFLTRGDCCELSARI